MTRAGRNATVALMAAAAMMVAGRASANDEPIAETGQREATIVVHVVNYAGLSNDVLNDARDRVARVYAVIGVRIVWVDDEETSRQGQGSRLHFTVMLLPRQMAQKKISAEGIKDGVLGQAHPSSGRAHIFCERIATMPGAPTYFAIPLGDVIAHEVGHLVLRTTSHSRSGIMRANANVHAIHLQSFDKTAARTIRAALIGLTAGDTGR